MKDLKHIKRFNESEENLNISDVSIGSDTITVTKGELETFLKEWSAGYQNIYDADWDEKSIRIVKFLGLDD
jgi:hypothetical protein